jgi:hypothetical protein
VEVSHHLADNFRRFTIGLVMQQAHRVQAVEDAAVDGLEAVAHIGQRAPDDHAHRVGDVGVLDLLSDFPWDDFLAQRVHRIVLSDV